MNATIRFNISFCYFCIVFVTAIPLTVNMEMMLKKILCNLFGENNYVEDRTRKTFHEESAYGIGSGLISVGMHYSF